MNIETLLIYTVVSFFYVTSPGPATLLAIFNGLRGNMKIVFISSFANIIGLGILSTASILGLGLLLKTSAVLFMAVKFIGAFYLIYLGVKYFKNTKTMNFNDTNVKKDKTKLVYFYEALILAITNPTPILFFTAIFPQFLSLESDILVQFLIMTSIFLSISFLSLSTYGLIAKRSKQWLSNNNRMKYLQRITGSLFIGMGLGLLQLKHNQN